MKEFQKIAIGLLGLTHPEMFIPLRKQGAGAAGTPESGCRVQAPAGEPLKYREGRVARILRAMKFTFTALAIGSRTVPLADNSQLLRDLSAHAACLYGPG
jgi:hypothetical protein